MTLAEKKAKNVLHQKKAKYGLTEEEYKKLFASQNNKCAICGCEFNENNKGFVDHSHINNEVRGLLCTKCNTLLGMANDNIEVLEKAIQYLKENSVLWIFWYIIIFILHKWAWNGIDSYAFGKRQAVGTH